MKIKTGKNIKAFLAVADSCEGHVWLESPWGDKYNLKSELSAYVAAYKLIKEGIKWLENSLILRLIVDSSADIN